MKKCRNAEGRENQPEGVKYKEPIGNKLATVREKEKIKFLA